MKDILFLNYRFKQDIIIPMFCLLFFVSCHTEEKKVERKENTASAFLKFFRSDILKNKTILLLDTPSDYSLNECLLRVTHEKEYALFDKDDFSDKSHSRLWNYEDINDVKLISKEALPNNLIPQHWSNFRKNLGEGYYVFSRPIVSEDLEYILFFTSYYCGDKCGYDTLALYKKTETGWKLVKKYCDGVS